jgi:mannose PTS system EIIA component
MASVNLLQGGPAVWRNDAATIWGNPALIGIVIVAHGGLAREFLSAVEHVVGRQSGVRAVSIDPECNRSMKQAEICSVADSVDEGEGVIIATDMFGGSPSNLSLGACRAKNRQILFGANLPCLIKLAKSRHLSVNEAVSAGLMAGRKYLDTIAEPEPELKLASGQS